MTTYSAIAGSEIDAESPITDLLLQKFRDNPLAVAEGDATAPAGLLPTVLLGTLNMAIGGTSQTLTGLVLTPYKFMVAVFNGVSTTATTGSIDFASCGVFPIGATNEEVRGIVTVDLNTGVGISSLASITAAAPANATSVSRVIRSSLSTASTSVSVSGATFDAGTVRIYGMK